MSENKADLRNVDRSSLKDIRTVHINTALPPKERVEDFVAQIGNPYCYLDGDIVVGVSYADTKATLQDKLNALAQQY